MFALQLVMYISLVVFFVGTVYKLIRIARMPLHIRWDLYPIPHEKGRGSYGGSYFEEVDWWTKPNDVSTVGELKAMGKEIFFIQSMYEHNRSLWVFSFPFHIGLYFSVGFVLMAFLGGALELGGLAVAPGGNVAGALVYYTIEPFRLASVPAIVVKSLLFMLAYLILAIRIGVLSREDWVYYKSMVTRNRHRIQEPPTT